jgi:hypothetical protein
MRKQRQSLTQMFQTTNTHTSNTQEGHDDGCLLHVTQRDRHDGNFNSHPVCMECSLKKSLPISNSFAEFHGTCIGYGIPRELHIISATVTILTRAPMNGGACFGLLASAPLAGL